MLAPLPPNEEARLSELTSCGVLDTPPEPVFDRVTRIAARIFHVPVSLIALVDRDRQWFKSYHGIDFTETARGHSFCAYTILEPGTMIVPDARLDPRFADCPLVVGPPHIRAYAGVPLATSQGLRLGTLCVIDTEPRRFDPEDIAMLEDLACVVVDELELRIRSALGQRELARRKHADQTMRASRDELEARVQERTAALAAAESRYRSLFENAVNGMYQTRPDATGFQAVNPAFANLLGYPTPQVFMDVVKDVATIYVHPERRAEFHARLMRDGVVSGLESEIVRSDGSRHWILEDARAIRDETGKLLRCEGSVMDITARIAARQALARAHEELEDRVRERTAEFTLLNGDLVQQIAERERAEETARRSENKFRALTENAQDLTVIIAPEGVLLHVSPSVEHTLGYLPDDLIGRDAIGAIVHPDDRDALRAQFADIVAAGTRYVRSEARFLHRDGSWRLLESIASCAPADFPIVSLILNARDITDRRRIEEEHEVRVRQQTAVAELGRYALEWPELPALFDKTTELITRALKVSFAVVTELLPGGEQLLVRAARGWERGFVGETLACWRTLGPDGNWIDREPLVIKDLRESPQYPALFPGPVSAASVVIQSGGRSFGTLSALSAETRAFEPQDVVFLQTVADLISTFIEGKRQEAVSHEAEARYQRIVANAPGAVFLFVLHPDGTIALPFISEGCRQIYEVDAATLIATPQLAIDAIHPDDLAAHRAAMAQSAITLQPFEWEGRIGVPSGATRWITVRSRPDRQPDGDILWDGLVLDVSELKRTQETLREAKEEAEKANLAKSELLSRMSHELRTPLNAILGFGQLLGLEALTPVQIASVEQIVKGGRHLLDLINEVLDIARIDSGGMDMTFERVAADVALDDAARFTRPLAEQNRVKFSGGAPGGGSPVVMADRGRLNQVLLNLFSNAVKYNRPDGEVRFACETLPGGETVRLSVTDTGPGLSAEDVDRLFTPFQRLDAAHRGIPGTGIGLTITRSLVEAMGGTVGVKSVPGQGSTFYVDLPSAPVQAAGATDPRPTLAAPEASVLPKVRTILHIDDQPATLSLVERVLEARSDLRLLSAGQGRVGLAMAREHLPDLILLDLQLPDLPGEEIARRLSNEARTRNIPIIVLSVDATPGCAARLRTLGVRGHVIKPFKIHELLRAVDAVFNPAPAAPLPPCHD